MTSYTVADTSLDYRQCMTSIGSRMPVLGSDTHCGRLQDFGRSPMSKATQWFARRVSQIHLDSGNDSFLHPETVLKELPRDRAMNCGSSHGHLTLVPYQGGRVSSPRDR